MRVFLTGGTGFIGSYVAKALLDAGHAVTILARNPDKVPALRALPGVTLLCGELADCGLVAANLTGHEALVHVALGWGDTAVDMLKNDTRPAVFLLEAAAKAGVERFLYTSSTAALGDLDGDVDEKTRTAPCDFYGATKAATEAFLLAAARKYPMRCNIIRPGYTFGNPVLPGAATQPDRRFYDIARQACRNEPVEVTRHDGTQFVWAGDLARLYLAVLDSEANRQTWFGLGNRFVSWEEIAREAIRLAGSSSAVRLLEKGYARRPNCYRVAKMKKDFGLAFDPRRAITMHLQYLVSLVKTSGVRS